MWLASPSITLCLSGFLIGSLFLAWAGSQNLSLGEETGEWLRQETNDDDDRVSVAPPFPDQVGDHFISGKAMRLQKEEPEGQPVVREQEFWNSELLLFTLCMWGWGWGASLPPPKISEVFFVFFFFF